MSNEIAELRDQVKSLTAENERLKTELTQTKKLRDQYSRELLLACPPPDYTDEEIANFINNWAPANGLLEEIDQVITKHGK